MLLEVRHVTQYHYDAFVRESVMEVWMQPQKSATQRLVSFELEVEPPAQLFSYADNYGNAVYHFDVPHPHERLTIVARSAVETQPPPILPQTLDRGEWDRLRSDFVRGECFDFLRPHGYAVETPALLAFIEKHALNDLRQNDPLSAVRALMAAIYSAFDYETGVTAADSPIDHALEEGRGVCQDFAHIMICGLKGLGLPAAYVSGYLRTIPPPGRPRLEGADATHAWVAVWCGENRGWIGFDPTNAVMVENDHIVLAMGRDYSDIAPIDGVILAPGVQKLKVEVDVIPDETGAGFDTVNGRQPQASGTA